MRGGGGGSDDDDGLSLSPPLTSSAAQRYTGLRKKRAESRLQQLTERKQLTAVLAALYDRERSYEYSARVFSLLTKA